MTRRLNLFINLNSRIIRVNPWVLICVNWLILASALPCRAELHICPIDKTDQAEEKLKIGGQLRLRGESVRNQNLASFNYNPGNHDTQLLSRTRLNLTLQPSDDIKAFVQGQLYRRDDHDDYSQGNLYQAYAEFSNIANLPVSLKVGRQDFCYGSAFFLGTNNFYDGLAWDGGKLRVAPSENFWVDLIGAHYVSLDKNVSHTQPALYGAYSQYKVDEDTAADFYFFYHNGGFTLLHPDTPSGPNWYTVGMRLAGTIKRQFDYEFEPLYQFGSVNNPNRSDHDTISAYGGHVEGGYTFDSKYKPRLFVEYALGSGEKNSRNARYQEFHGNIYNDNYLVGDSNVVADMSGITIGNFRASGMQILVAGATGEINSDMAFYLNGHYFRAESVPAGISREIGTEINTGIIYKPLPNVTITASANRFITGKFFKDASGSDEDISYYYLQTEIDF